MSVPCFAARLIATAVVFASLPLAAASYVFTNGRLVTMTQPQAVEGELVVVDGRIASVGGAAARPAGAIVVDMQGGYLLPGLAEMHAHVPSPGQGLQYRDDVLFLWVAGGITTARGMLGHPDHLELRRALQDHKVLGPRLITSGPSFSGGSVTSPEQAQQMVVEQKQAGYDFLKIHPGMSREEYDAMAQTADRVGIRFAGHVPAEVGLSHALARGQLTIDHLDGYIQEMVPDLDPQDPALASFFGAALVARADESSTQAITDRTLAARAWVVPTETLLENFADAARLDELVARPETAYLPRQLLENYKRALGGAAERARETAAYVQLRKRLLKNLYDSGVGVLLGSDSPQIFNVPGFSLHRELASMVAAGLTPYQALLTGTVNPAKFFAMENEFGQLRVGLSADFVLVTGNPLEDVGNAANVQGVMVRGHWLDSEARNSGLAEIRTRYAQ